MPYGLYMSADGVFAQNRLLQITSNNLANVTTPGFKRELAVFQARDAEAINQGEATAGSGSINDIGGGTIIHQTVTDFSQGPMKQTSVPTDMAIQGEGFFMVRKDGEDFLTRAGNFRMTNQGELVTAQGFPVINDTGAPIVCERANGPWELTSNGVIRQLGIVQNLALVKPASLGDLVKVGENLFRPLAETMPIAPGQRNVSGGMLEMSTANPTTEMVNLVTASRLLEANARMIQTQDQMLNGVINRLMKVS